MIVLRTLGALDISDADEKQAAVLTQPKRLALLVYLATNASAGFRRRDSLVALFWPELDQEHARGALRQAVRFLRRSLGEGVIIGRGDEELGINPAALQCDATAFEFACESGNAAEALELYRGPFLDALFASDVAPEFEHWVNHERIRLDDRAREAGWTLADRAAAIGDMAAAATWARRAASMAHDDERAQCRLVMLLDRLGDRAGALQVYDDLATRLAGDFGSEPSPETQALIEAVRSRSECGQEVFREQDVFPEAVYARGGNAPQLRGAASVAPAPLARVRRIRWMILASAIVLTLVGATAWLRRQPHPALDPLRVLVNVFQNRTGDSTLDPVGEMAADWITHGLMRTEIVTAVPASTVRLYSRHIDSGSSVGGRSAAVTLARQQGAGTLISGAFYRQGDTLRFLVDVIDASRGKLVATVPLIGGPTHDPLSAVEGLRQRVTGLLAMLLDPKLGASASVASQPPTYEAYREFVEGRELMDRERISRVALPHFRRAVTADSTFTLPLLWSMLAYLELADYARADSIAHIVEASRARLAPLDRLLLDRCRARLRGDLPAAYRASRSIVRLAPRSQFVQLLADDAWDVNRPREAVEALKQLDPELPWVAAWESYWTMLAYRLHDLGEYEQQLAVIRRARQLRPDKLRFLWLEVQALAALGRLTDVQHLLDESLALPFDARRDPNTAWTAGEVMRTAALELRAHGHRAAADAALDRAMAWYDSRPRDEQATLAQRKGRLDRLYEAGFLDRAKTLAEDLAAEDSSDMYVRAFLGAIAARRGDRVEAARISQWLQNQTRPYVFGSNTYMSATIAALLGERQRAVVLLREARAQGVGRNQYDHLQIDFESLRDYPPFQLLMRPEG